MNARDERAALEGKESARASLERASVAMGRDATRERTRVVRDV